jgi:HTH-like domain
MNMSPSTYHYSSVQTDEPDLILKKQIEAIIELLPESGYRPVTAKLRESMIINGKKVLRVMKKYQLLCNKSKAFRKPTTQSNHDLKKYANKIADLRSTTAGNRW